MTMMLRPEDKRLIEAWQRDLPLVPHPFAEIGAALGLSEEEVLARLRHLAAMGAIARVGGTCRPNTIGASTLAAMEVPDLRVDEVAAIVGAEPGVNHSYLRENALNLWFVGTGPDRLHLDATLARIEKRTGLRVLDLPLVRAFNVDLGFPLEGERRMPPASAPADLSAIRPDDGAIIQAMTDGLALVARPFAALGDDLGRAEMEVISRLRALTEARILTRLGIIVRHRAIGWRSNAMVVWDVPEDEIDRAGPALAGYPGVTLCYQRRPAPGKWRYRLYSMIHARTRSEALDILTGAADLPELRGKDHEVLFSLRCFKQTGALVHDRGTVAA
ncbi:AsnC family transcriptional regulator [Defluviimonas sp. WL0024]|uniref:siroheme decarboxylase n=1 Tax=Albidovulum salinarum TaxID=2984153 RepID=A0ABT2X4H0_9RHOB|nr:AsnC family transcriptional regulator [Defluviimonas sp. WL0024]MCU9848834.1 AsnC family transcriptional regulator [Defluviimonas sp. WL0024]